MSEFLYQRVVTALGDQYAIEGEIGRGGMAVVYRARDLRLKREVAIKVLPPELSHDPAVRTRFAREAHTAAQLSHPHIVPIYDVGERDGIAYFVMALVTGGNLASLLARIPRPPLDEVRRLMCEIADALGYAHLRGVIHRDIKPDNILLDKESGRAMVTDFGIARAMEAGARLTATGNAVGTPTYMSPEQAVGERAVDGRADLYSLGVLGYQMLTGRVPFSAGNSMALLLKHVTERPKPIAELRPDVPRPLRDAIERALLKAPEDRWPTAEALRDALRSDDVSGHAWRAESRDPVRYTTPDPDGGSARRWRWGRKHARVDLRVASPRRGEAPRLEAPRPDAALAAPLAASLAAPRAPGELVLEPPHLASLTPEQRADLRLWHGRIHLLDRVKAMRGYFWLTAGSWMGALGLFAVAVEEGIPPLVFAPVVSAFMTRKLWRRGQSLREAGLKLRRVLLMPRAKWVLPKPAPAPVAPPPIEQLAPREVLESPLGAAVRRAAQDRAAIADLVAKLPKEDRALLPDLAPTADALFERVTHIAQAIQRLDEEVDPRLVEELDAGIAAASRAPESPDRERRLAQLRRQRTTLDELASRRETLAQQFDNAALALGGLRLDLIRVRSSGLESALSDVSTATQEARALSREIGVVLDAAAEARGM